MNGIIKRLIGVLFISLFVFNMGVQTYAADDLPVRKTNLDKDVYFVVNKADEQEIREIQLSLEKDYSAPGVVYNEKAYFGGVSNGVSDYFYNQLNSLQKEMYNNFDAECQKFIGSNVNITDDYVCTVKGSYSLTYDEILQVYYCFYFSNPQYFFVSNNITYGSGYDYEQNQYYKYLAPVCYSNCKNYDDRKAIKDSIDSLTSSWLTTLNKIDNEVEKEIQLAKLISDKVTYTHTDYDQSLMGALYYGQCVCNGYAMTMNYFCNLLGIECITIISTNHAWNRILLNGDWFETDVTNYDQESYYWDFWLNKSTEHFLSYSGAVSHEPLTNHYYLSNKTLPACVTETPKIVYDPVLTASQTADKSTMEIELKNAGTSANVWFLMWSDENGQDDAHWYAAEKQWDGRWTYSAAMSDYSTNGTYILYAFEGNSYPETGLAVCHAEVSGLKALPVLTASQTADKSTMEIELKNAGTSANVWFLMWSDENGQDDAHWYAAEKQWDGRWTYSAAMSDYSTNGTYILYAFEGNSYPETGLAVCHAEVSGLKALPEIQTDLWSDGSTMNIILNNVDYSNIWVVMWSQANGQDDALWYYAGWSPENRRIITANMNDFVDKGTFIIYAFTGTAGPETMVAYSSCYVA